MSYPLTKTDKEYTYSDYLNWPDDERWELIAGVAYNMTPAPSRIHQKVSAALFNEIYNYLKNKTCEVYSAPFDVRLPAENEKDETVKTVVQPDIVVVCDPSKLDEKGCIGSPDLIVEIVSPTTASLDYIQKLRLYERHRVKEYWIVHPIDKIVMIYQLLENNSYGRAEIFSEESRISVGIFPDLTINMKMVFTE